MASIAICCDAYLPRVARTSARSRSRTSFALLQQRQRHSSPTLSSSSALFGKKPDRKKLSYAERLKLDRERQAGSCVPATPEPLPAEAPQIGLAKQMIAAQRKSLDMLAFVRERVEGLPAHILSESLDTIGFCVLDSFLGSEDVISMLQAEGEAMLREADQMQTDLRALGSGDFFATITGGEEQYPHCPRTIELVVSMTKHFATLLKGSDDLSPRNCMATMRTFDRKALLASNALAVEGAPSLPPLPFGIVADDQDDTRKVTILYYPISVDWYNEGGVTFQQDRTVVMAKRDRLIIFRSDTCKHRREAFIGREGLNTASFLELHLVCRLPLEPDLP